MDIFVPFVVSKDNAYTSLYLNNPLCACTHLLHVVVYTYFSHRHCIIYLHWLLMSALNFHSKTYHINSNNTTSALVDRNESGGLTTWFCAQMDTTPLEMETMIGRTGCHWKKQTKHVPYLLSHATFIVTLLSLLFWIILCHT